MTVNFAYTDLNMNTLSEMYFRGQGCCPKDNLYICTKKKMFEMHFAVCKYYIIYLCMLETLRWHFIGTWMILQH